MNAESISSLVSAFQKCLQPDCGARCYFPTKLVYQTSVPSTRGEASSFVAMSDIDGLKMMNDKYGYSAGDMLIRAFAKVLLSVGLDAYHNQGDEFLCKGSSFQELNTKLSQAQLFMKKQKFVAESLSGRVAKLVPSFALE